MSAPPAPASTGRRDRRIAPSGSSSVDTVKIENGVRARKPRPSNSKIGVELHRPLVKTGGFPYEIANVEVVTARLKSQAPKIRIVSFRMVCRFSCQRLLFATG